MSDLGEPHTYEQLCAVVRSFPVHYSGHTDLADTDFVGADDLRTAAISGYRVQAEPGLLPEGKTGAKQGRHTQTLYQKVFRI